MSTMVSLGTFLPFSCVRMCEDGNQSGVCVSLFVSGIVDSGVDQEELVSAVNPFGQGEEMSFQRALENRGLQARSPCIANA